MIAKLTRFLGAVGIVAMTGALLGSAALRADEPDQDNKRPPQTLPQGFESTDRLLRDLEKAENAPLYSAWLVESSRFVDVASGSFMPDRAFIPGSTDPKHNLAFFDFPAEHWDHLRTANPIESVFATVRHRTVRTKGALSQDTARLMVFKLVMAAAKTWRRLKGENQLPKVVQGVTFRDGVEVTDTPAQSAA